MRADAVADVAHVAVERLDVVAVRVQEESGVVAGAVIAIAGLAVRAETCVDPALVEPASTCSRSRA